MWWPSSRESTKRCKERHALEPTLGGYLRGGPARVNSDKRDGPKSSDSQYNEIASRDNLPRPNCDSEGKADNKRQAFINTNTRCFKIQTGDM